MSKRKRGYLTPNELYLVQKYHRDYARTARAPTKMCRRCERTFPNDENYFATGPTGMITGHCKACYKAVPESTRVEGICPICRAPAMLKIDHRAPLLQPGTPARLCSACLIYMARVEGVDFETTLKRAIQYMSWRSGKVDL